MIGSVNFASVHSHEHWELSRRDDLISLGYILYYLYYGDLEWSKINVRENYEENNKISYTEQIQEINSKIKDLYTRNQKV